MVGYFKHSFLTLKTKNMGFNKTYLPDKEAIEEQYKSIGHTHFIDLWKSRLRKSDAIIGPSDSLSLIEKLIKEDEKISELI